MQTGEQLKYGWAFGGKVSVPVPMAASQDVLASSTKFVYMNDGAATLCTDGTGQVFGHVEIAEGTPSTGDVVNCIIDKSAIFKMRVSGGTYVVGMIGDTCDMELDSLATGVQSAQLDAGDENTLVVVGGDATNNNWVLVMMNANEMGETGVV